MFARGRIFIGICTLLIIAVSFAVTSYVTAVLNAAYFYTMGGFAFSLLLAGFVCMELYKTDSKGIPIVFANLFIALGYVLFTLLMFIPFACDVSASTLRLWQIVGLLVVLICHILVGMMHRAAVDLAAEQRRAMKSKRLFILELERFKSEHSALLAEHPELDSKFISLSEAVRFCSESTEASVEIDEKISGLLQQFHTVSAAEEAAEKMQEISNQISYRNQLIKISR